MAKNQNSTKKKAGFRAAKQNRIFQDIVEQIQESILNGKFKQGDILPPERELKEMFQTSRGTLREALRVLEQKGLIEIRLGVNGGAFVKGDISDPVVESLGLMIRYRQISLVHLNEFREDVEGFVTARAAERANKADILELENLLAKAKEFAEKGFDHCRDFLEIDRQFHRQLAKISRNPIYIFMYNVIHSNIQSYYDEFLHMDEMILQENYQDLSDILDSVRKGNSDQARLLAQSHLQRFYEHMAKHNDHDSA